MTGPSSFSLKIESFWESGKRRLARALGRQGTPMILPYRGFGTEEFLWVRGRVIEDQGVVSAIHSDSLLTNLRHTFKRYETDEIPDAKLEWRWNDQTGTVKTDGEGYFDFTIQRDENAQKDAWQDVHLRLLDAPGYETQDLSATVPVRTPSTEAQFGIISDIDDTIIKTGATNFVKHWRTVVANSAESRVGYDNLPRLYRDLTDNETNPVFYVSSSPWNLFDLFERYMLLNDIPLGPMLLKDFGMDENKWLTGGHDGHKTKQIERLFETYPHLPFILVGDSGQRDVEIYTGIAQKYPERIKAVVIHDVTEDARDAEARNTLAELAHHKFPVIYTSNYGDVIERLNEADTRIAQAEDNAA